MSRPLSAENTGVTAALAVIDGIRSAYDWSVMIAEAASRAASLMSVVSCQMVMSGGRKVAPATNRRMGLTTYLL